MRILEMLNRQDKRALLTRSRTAARTYMLAVVTIERHPEECPERQLAAMVLTTMGHKEAEIDVPNVRSRNRRAQRLVPGMRNGDTAACPVAGPAGAGSAAGEGNEAAGEPPAGDSEAMQ